jgi:hypothetical protein
MQEYRYALVMVNSCIVSTATVVTVHSACVVTSQYSAQCVCGYVTVQCTVRVLFCAVHKAVVEAVDCEMVYFEDLRL